MPSYLNNNLEKCDTSSYDNTSNNIKTSIETISNGIDDIQVEKNIEKNETFEEMKRKNSNNEFIDYNEHMVKLSPYYTTTNHRGKNKNDDTDDNSDDDNINNYNNNNNSGNNNQDNTISNFPNNILDLSEYFKPENYLNEEFKKKNCKIIKRLLWGELFEEKKKRIRKVSPYGKLKTWDLKCVIIKGGDDLRQELLASQLIKQFKIIFENAGLPLWLRPYEILVTGSNSGIIEYVNDTCSVDSLKRKFGADSISTIFNIVFSDYIFEAKKVTNKKINK